MSHAPPSSTVLPELVSKEIPECVLSSICSSNCKSLLSFSDWISADTLGPYATVYSAVVPPIQVGEGYVVSVRLAG